MTGVQTCALPISIIVDRPFAIARRHELRHTHCARIAAFKVKNVLFFFFRHQQKLNQLVLEKLGATRIIKTQSTQSIGNTEAACVFAVVGLNPDNRHNQLGRYTVFARHIIDNGTVGGVKLFAAVEFRRTGVACTEFIPRARSRRAVHDIDDIALVNHAIEEVLQLGFRKLLFRRLVTDKLADIGIGIKAAAGNRFRSRIKSRTLVFALINRLNR